MPGERYALRSGINEKEHRKKGRHRLPSKARHLPPRIAAGPFILDAGAGKRSAGKETAARH